MDELAHRVGTLLEMLVDLQGGDDVYVVTHNGSVRMAMLLNAGISVSELFTKPSRSCTGRLRLRPDRLREWRPVQSVR